SRDHSPGHQAGQYSDWESEIRNPKPEIGSEADGLWDWAGGVGGVPGRDHAGWFYPNDGGRVIFVAERDANVHGPRVIGRQTGLHALGHLLAGGGALSIVG